MLLELRISNFALFDQIQLNFEPGFIVFTGETGAGKSLLVDALALVLGGRVVGDQIRKGAEEAHLEAIFSIGDLSEVQAWLESLDLAAPESEEVVIRRILSRSGRNRAYINGTATPVQQLQELGKLMLDIHGQHDQQSLLSPQVQLDLVDAFGGLSPLRMEFETEFHRWQELYRAWNSLCEQARDRNGRQEFLQHEYDELCKADLRAGEEEALLLEYRRLQNSEKLADLSNQAYSLLHEHDPSILSSLQQLKRVVQELRVIEPSAHSWNEILEGVNAQSEELAHSFRDYRDGIEHDPNRLGQIDERLSLLQRLQRKYHDTIEGLMAKREHLQAELSQLSNIESHLQTLEEQFMHAYKEACQRADVLSKARKQVAERLQRRVMKELADLKMEHTQFLVRFHGVTGDQGFNSTGSDRVEYLFCANPGEALQPLGRVASGGELSRLMLAVKTVFADVDQIPVLVFDEIDTGVGGEVASVMGQRLHDLGNNHQVFCLTHLPQIAAQAAQHFVVEKVVTQGRTTTRVLPLGTFERRNEIARMLGGEQLTTTVRKAAAEMLQSPKKSSR